LTYFHNTYNLSTNLFGGYNLENVRAAIAIGLFLGVEITDIIDAVEKYVPANNRSQVKTTKSNTLICDSYNANPTSVNAALSSFLTINATSKAIIFGDMLELGDKSEEEHLKVLKSIKSILTEEVYLVGPVFQKISAGSGFNSFGDVNRLIEFIKGHPLTGKTILIKGSRGIRLEKIYELL
jgi:UDP-N-acetylmuramoyl-tripeptide--D-alanyl-D-alanine ligase